ncbi:YkgJ family cysteine cluster protein [Sorangium sp. So ce385]|uniref:YkgJ family cysteine cluster protein n=1 Tax=Sorangium sp. So ce385 TaxID=3133308 RepID=UPI003F5B78F9
MTRPTPPRGELIVRPGARFACVGGGLCCSDLHALGPLARRDVVRLRRRAPDALGRHERIDVMALRAGTDGACVFLSGGACSLHGTADKPLLCRRFPYGAVQTPLGIRVTTAHRCPCRTLGDRPPVRLDEAVRSLRDGRGRLAPHAAVGDRIPFTRRTSLSLARYVAIEAGWIERLVRGETASAVLGVEETWAERHRAFLCELGGALRTVDTLGTAFDHALAWFGHGLLSLLGAPGAPPARPWSAHFDAAERRAPQRRTAAEVLGDFAADALWDLRWAARSTFERLATDLALRLAVADAVARALGAMGLRPDRAAAEAVMIAELAGDSAPWTDALDLTAPFSVRPPAAERSRARD